MPLFPWALLITGGMLLPTLPILSGALLMVLADLHSNTLFFDPIFGGDPLFYQHLIICWKATHGYSQKRIS
jgi:cytochrome c oxidase subunit 1